MKWSDYIIEGLFWLGMFMTAAICFLQTCKEMIVG